MVIERFLVGPNKRIAISISLETLLSFIQSDYGLFTFLARAQTRVALRDHSLTITQYGLKTGISS
jgi:hypothetical protein